MFAIECYEDLYSSLSDAMEELPKRELRELLSDQGMVGDIAKQEAENRGWAFEVEVEHTDSMTSVSVSVSAYGSDDDDEDED